MRWKTAGPGAGRVEPASPPAVCLRLFSQTDTSGGRPSPEHRRDVCMRVYQGSEIRNVAVVGHAHSGKTTLVSALLYAAKMTQAPGRVEDGSAVTAYDEEEVARRTTMATAVAFAEWGGIKVNLLDTPGFHMFVHEARCA